MLKAGFGPRKATHVKRVCFQSNVVSLFANGNQVSRCGKRQATVKSGKERQRKPTRDCVRKSLTESSRERRQLRSRDRRRDQRLQATDRQPDVVGGCAAQAAQ